MQKEGVSFFEWQEKFHNEEACREHLAQERWKDGFQCLHCGHDHAHWLPSRGVFQCSGCHKHTSVTAGTLFHSTKLPLKKWYWEIYLVGSDKGGVSALRLSKLLGVSWPTARLMLTKIRAAMGHRDSLYRLSDWIELDDAFVGGKRAGKRGRGAAGKTPMLVACENREEKAGFIAMKAIEKVNSESVGKFAVEHLFEDQYIATDAYPPLKVLGETQYHMLKTTPPEKVDSWLPWVHIVISNFKRFVLGTYHGVSSRYMQEYINEFCYRFNRRSWEPQIPNRLLGICVSHLPVKAC